MQIFSNKNKELNLLNEKPFKLEKEIQTLFEENLSTISNLKFVKSEFTIKGYRIDTLAYDEESKSFVIIEYKRERNFSVIDQGVTYLNLMLEYKSDFIVEYNESCQHNLKRDQIDWSQSKIIFVSPAFTDYQKQSTNFKDLAIELWEVKRFENDLLLINSIKKSKSAPSIKEVQPKQNPKLNAQTDSELKLNESELERVTSSLIVYDEAYHFEGKSDDVIELYEDFKNAILTLAPELEIVSTKLYVAFKRGKNNIVSIQIQKKLLKIWFSSRQETLDDPKQLTKDVTNIGHWGTGDYELIASDTENLEYIMSLIKQAL